MTTELHSRALVIDSHCDTILKVLGSRGEYSLGELHPTEHVDIPRLQQGGVDVQFFAAYIGAEYKPDRAVKRTLQLLDCLHREIEANQDTLRLILKASDIDSLKSHQHIGVLISIEGGEALEGELAALRIYHRLGVRAVGLTWNERNQIAEGVGECRSGGGLTDFGVSVVAEMNRLGMIVDVSHISEPGFYDVLEVSKHPIIASHSNARAVCGHVRNLADRQIRALAANGGVMGMNFAPEFLVEHGEAHLDDVMMHIDHIVNLLGNSKHVGLGGDLDGISRTPRGLEDVTKYPALTEALLRRGYSEEALLDILGLNHLRVIRTVLG
jgi:membrane dipeptidase